MTQNPEKYTHFAIFLHWLMFLLIFVMFGLGWYMVDLPKGSEERTWFFTLHKSIGLTLALLVLIRVFWRILYKPPPLPDYLESWKQKLALVTHNFLYVFMFLQPASGYISSSFSGYKTKFWGYPLPQWGWKEPTLNELFTEIHEISAIGLMCFIILHILGVVSHVINSELKMVQRMLPGGKK